MTSINRLYVFDLDGVVTDPETGTVNADVLQHVAEELRHGRAVAFNTGRPFEWVEERILPALTQEVPAESLDHLLAVCEMGGVLCTFRGGKMHLELDPDLSLPGSFVEDVQDLLEKEAKDGRRYGDYVAWDGVKKTMGTVMKWDHVALDDFNAVRPQIQAEFEALLKKHGLDDFVIGQTTIATDIQHKTAGKHKGAQQVLAWLQQKELAPGSVQAFGDSVSDKAMAEEFAANGIETTFVYVGSTGHEHDVQSDGYKTVVTGGGFSNDTANYLAQQA
jgi:hydroxymethylpyrimidine pyrophosphatase-like HAD family hydrolase